MQGPSFLPRELEYCTLFATDEELSAALIKNPSDLVHFFEVACEDEGWFEEHPKLIRSLLRRVARDFYLYRFPPFLAKRMAAAMQNHYLFLRPFLFFRPALFFTVQITVENETIPVNAFLFGVGSPYFYHFFRTQCFDKMRDFADLPDIPLVFFHLVEEYLSKGTVDYLWKSEQREILELMKLARALSVPGLVSECAAVLRRYIDKDNVSETLLQSYRESFRERMDDCAHFFNEQGWGIRIVTEQQAGLKVEFLDYKQETLERYDFFAPYVTHLAFSGHLSEEPYYKEIVAKSPKLVGLDFCNASRYANQFEGIKQDITEIDLSACSWLRPEHFREIGTRFPGIRALYLGNNAHLDYLCWSEFSRFKQLKILHVPRCKGMTDDDLKLISRSCPSLTEWNGEESYGFSDKGMIEIIRHCGQLRILCINRCSQLTDKILFELGAVALLTSLSINRCSFSEKALLNFLELSRNLEELHAKQCNVSDGAIAMIRTRYPRLTVTI